MGVFTSLGHVALRVKDLGASLAFYEALGFPEMLRLLDDKGEPWIVYLRITDELYLELFPKAEGEKVPGPEAIGVTHLCLTVEDIDATAAHLAGAGIPLSKPRRPGRGVDGNRGMWIEDPDGNRIEIMEMAPDCIQYQAVRNIRAGNPPAAIRAVSAPLPSEPAPA